jgi:shikimate dehydrogenase
MALTRHDERESNISPDAMRRDKSIPAGESISLASGMFAAQVAKQSLGFVMRRAFCNQSSRNWSPRFKGVVRRPQSARRQPLPQPLAAACRLGQDIPLRATAAESIWRRRSQREIVFLARKTRSPPNVISPSLQEICSLFGQPVAGNPTQFMIEKAFARHGLEWRYLTLEVAPEDLADAVRGMRAMGFRGGNITKPHKVAVLEHLDRLSDAAALMGAVNCIIREERELVGENTDGKGFMQSLTGIVDPAGKRVVLLGAGGAARAIGVELALAGAAAITVVNRTAERGQELVDLLNQKTKTPATLTVWENEYEIPAEAELLVNATSIGLNDPEAPVPVRFGSAVTGLVVADVIASPPDTRFLQEAKTRGAKTLDGLGMIVNQGAIAFRLWTGIEPDKTVMREAVEEFLGL